MMAFRFTKPSLRRVLWSIVLVAVACCVIAGIAVSIGFILSNESSEPVPKGEYVRLFVVDITFWGPMYLLIVWWATIPAIIGLGVLAACVRRTTAPKRASHQ
jgi:hypothetical protein